MTHQEDKNFLKMLLIVIGALVVFFIISITLANIIGKNKGSEGKGPDPMVAAATKERIKQIGEVNIGTAPVAVASSGGEGESTYSGTCVACHGSGALGSPKFGDKAAWKPRIAKGLSTLFKHALHGFNNMPAKGGNGSLSDDAVKAAVKYMVDHAK